jgi:uncharacterized protein involved in outer membrane biogenesis
MPEGGYAFDDLKVKIGASSLAGSGTLAIAGPRPKVKAQLVFALLDLSELLLKEEKARTGPSLQNVAGSGQDRRVFPADPLPLSALKVADADLDLKAGRLVLPNTASLEALTARLVLSNGRLEIQALSSRIGGGAMTGNIGLDGSAGGTATLAAKVDVKAMDLGQMLRQMGNPDLVTGTKTNLAMTLRGSGGSVRELMAGLNGDVLLVLGEGKIKAGFLEWLGADLLTQIAEKVNPFRKTDPYTELKCGVIRFAARGGIASTDKGIAFETSKMILVSSGTVNLKTEAIDLSLRPDTRQVVGIGASDLVKLLRLRGTLAEPKFGLDEVETAKRAVSIGAAVATAGLSFLAESLAKRALADPRPCETALARTSPPIRAGGQETPKAGNGAEQFLRGLFGK